MRGSVPLARRFALGCRIPAPHVHFPVDCNIALLAHLPGHPALEIAMVGREGLVGAHVMLGAVSAPLAGQGARGGGWHWRIGVRAFREELVHSAALDIGLRRYLHVLMTQLSTAASCARFHTDRAAPGTLAADVPGPGAVRPARRNRTNGPRRCSG